MTPFGTTADGRTVHALRLSAGDLTVTLLTLGACLQDLRLAGVPYPLTLGSTRVQDYEGQMRHHGTLIAPVVNRLSGAQAPIAGKLHRFQANQDGRYCRNHHVNHIGVFDFHPAFHTNTHQQHKNRKLIYGIGDFQLAFKRGQ